MSRQRRARRTTVDGSWSSSEKVLQRCLCQGCSIRGLCGGRKNFCTLLRMPMVAARSPRTPPPLSAFGLAPPDEKSWTRPWSNNSTSGRHWTFKRCSCRTGVCDVQTTSSVLVERERRRRTPALDVTTLGGVRRGTVAGGGRCGSRHHPEGRVDVHCRRRRPPSCSWQLRLQPTQPRRATVGRSEIGKANATKTTTTSFNEVHSHPSPLNYEGPDALMCEVRIFWCTGAELAAVLPVVTSD